MDYDQLDLRYAQLSGATFSGPIHAPNHLTSLSGFCAGVANSGEIVMAGIFPTACQFPQSAQLGKATVAATVQTAFSVFKYPLDGSARIQIGVFVFNAGSTTALRTGWAGAEVEAGQLVAVECQTGDATLANIAFLIKAS